MVHSNGMDRLESQWLIKRRVGNSKYSTRRLASRRSLSAASRAIPIKPEPSAWGNSTYTVSLFIRLLSMLISGSGPHVEHPLGVLAAEPEILHQRTSVRGLRFVRKFNFKIRAKLRLA